MKLTSLYEKHLELNAKIVPFAGYKMPVTYKKITDEKLKDAAVESAKLQDTLFALEKKV